MSKIIASSDITLLDFSVLLDFSTYIPTCLVTNLSTVVNANNLKWVFEFKSPNGTEIHVGSFSTPDVDGVAFTTFQFIPLDDNGKPTWATIPMYFGQLEYGQDPYTVKVMVKDDAGNIFDLTKGASLCKVNGNEGKGNFGKADIDVEVKCDKKLIFVNDKTNLIYKSIVGTKVSTVVFLSYPKDSNGNELPDTEVASIPALIPIKYEGDGHEIYVAHVYQYNLGDNFNVMVRYSFREVFGVWCNVNLQPLLCEVSKVTDKLSKECFDTVDNREKHKKLGLANAKILQAVIGVMQPLSGFDVPALIEDVKRILEIECDCCRPAGISDSNGILLSDAVLTANKVCGDMTLSWDNDGEGNIVLNYQDKSYTFDVSGSNAFDWVPSLAGCVKNNVLTVDMDELSTEILTAITDNPTLLNILNGITTKAQLSCSGLDGGDAFDFSSCDYSVVIDTLGTGKTFVNILIGGTTYTAPSGTLITDATAIATFLNSLSKGTFMVVYSSGTNKLTITTAANTNNISTVTTLLGSTSKTQQVTNNCGLICTVLQKILDYANGLDLVQVKTGIGLTVCRFETDGKVLSKTFADTESSSVVAKYIADSICNVVNYMKDKFVSCANVKELFASFTSEVIDGADTLPMWIDGKCVEVPFKEMAKAFINLINSDSDVKALYCTITPCSTLSTCNNVTNLNGTGGDTTWSFTWTGVAGAIGYKYSKDGVNWITTYATAAYLTGLTVNTAYTFRVYPVYPSGDGNACTVTNNFTTTNTGATCAAPGSLVLDNAGETYFTATWNAVSGATGYQYRLNGGAWANIGNVLTTTPTGLVAGTSYDFDVRAIIGGTPCTDMSSDNISTTAVSPINVFIENEATVPQITNVTNAGTPYIAISAGALPLNPSDTLTGIHAGFTGAIRVTVASATFTAKATLSVNGTFIQCIDLLIGAGNHFDSRVYLSTDIIHIVITDGVCGA